MPPLSIRILGTLHGNCKKEGLSIWAEFDMLMRCLHTREVTQSQSNHPRPSQFFQVKTFTLAPFSSLLTIVCKCLQWFKVSKTEAFVLPANDVDCSHTQDGHRYSGFIDSWGGKGTLSSRASRVALPWWLDLGTTGRCQGEVGRRWRWSGLGRSLFAVETSFSGCCWTGWRPTGSKGRDLQGTWTLYSTCTLGWSAEKELPSASHLLLSHFHAVASAVLLTCLA